MDAVVEIGRNPVSKHQIQVEDEQADAGRKGPNPSRETKFSGANGDREKFIFPAQLTTSRIVWQPYPVDPSLVICDDHTYIHRGSSKNCTSRERVSPLSRLIRGFRNKYH